MSASQGLPGGTVTLLFSDIEGSTTLVQRLGTTGWADLLSAHQGIIREAVARGRGREIKTEGDSFFVVFPTARAAVEAAVDIQRGLAAHPWPDDAVIRVRVGLHTGEGVVA